MANDLTLLEKVAKAIHDKRCGAGCKPWAHRTIQFRDPYLMDAQAAIDTIRAEIAEPNDEMLIAGLRITRDPGYGHVHDATGSAVYRAMFAASPLGGQKDG